MFAVVDENFPNLAHSSEWVLFLPFVHGCTIIETNTAQKKTKSSLTEPCSIRRDSHCGFEHFFCGYMIVLRPVAQLYGQARTDWNQCFVIDCSLSHPAGHKPFTCSHSVLRNT